MKKIVYYFTNSTPTLPHSLHKSCIFLNICLETILTICLAFKHCIMILLIFTFQWRILIHCLTWESISDLAEMMSGWVEIDFDFYSFTLSAIVQEEDANSFSINLVFINATQCTLVRHFFIHSASSHASCVYF